MDEPVETLEVSAECSLFDVGCWLSAWADWVVQVLLWVPRKFLELLLDGLALAVEAIPVPEAFALLDSYGAGIAGGTVYFLDVFEVPAGVGMVAGALAARFLIRLLPFVG